MSSPLKIVSRVDVLIKCLAFHFLHLRVRIGHAPERDVCLHVWKKSLTVACVPPANENRDHHPLRTLPERRSVIKSRSRDYAPQSPRKGIRPPSLAAVLCFRLKYLNSAIRNRKSPGIAVIEVSRTINAGKGCPGSESHARPSNGSRIERSPREF